MSLTFGSLFSGIGGFDLGLERAGMSCAWQVEIDDYCTKVLQKHWPDVPKFGDIRDVGKHNLETVDLICGGFPCQDVSLAGKRKGLKGKRSTLWSEFYRIICEVRPKWVLIENVPGLLSSDNGGFFRKILGELSQSGYDAEWQTLSAAVFGAPHIRERLFLVAYAGSRGCNGFPVFKENSIEVNPYWFAGTTDKMVKIGGRRFPGYTDDIRMGYGISEGMDFVVPRIKGLGNAVVPQVAEFIGRIILEAEHE